ncbi:hypothetical protein CLV59_103293 [Chitinophaga dinghuensis]|uniref:Immunity protein 50 of polymorphic toxin system n=1 Tax=Chitinophaga dinghuensis TaxID=1539050 RepID=A0A327W260_9BACT|nr:hypothetical protein CLV59_103293 [Chitinophaga dinghuensis]
MLYIDKNEGLINYLSGKYSLISSKLYRMDIYNDAKSDLIVDLYFELLYTPVNSRIKLTFTEIEEYSFYHHRSNYFYNVERLKFLRKDNFMYLSIDPYDEDQNISIEDRDFILSKNVEGYFI